MKLLTNNSLIFLTQLIKTALKGKANVAHNHEINDVNNLQNALDNKATLDHTHNNLVSKVIGNTTQSEIIVVPMVSSAVIDPTQNEETYLKEWFKWVCINYPNLSGKVFMGSVLPNAAGMILARIYNTSEVNSSGHPRYANFVYYPLPSVNSDFFTGGFNNYAWNISRYYLNDLAVKGHNHDAAYAPKNHSHPIDSVLSETSTNPVQNKVVTAALNGKAPTVHNHNDLYYGKSEVFNKQEVNALITQAPNAENIYNKQEIDSKFSNYYNKPQVDTMISDRTLIKKNLSITPIANTDSATNVKYPYKYTLPFDGVTAEDIAEVSLAINAECKEFKGTNAINGAVEFLFGAQPKSPVLFSYVSVSNGKGTVDTLIHNVTQIQQNANDIAALMGDRNEIGLTDKTTNKKYKLYIMNGKLMMEEVI